MNDQWLSVGVWMLHTAVGGGLLLLLTCVLMRWTLQPARRQRLGECGMAAALVVAVGSALGPSWLVIAWNPGETRHGPFEVLSNPAFAGKVPLDEIDLKDDGVTQAMRGGVPSHLTAAAPLLAREHSAVDDEAAARDLASWLEQFSPTIIAGFALLSAFFTCRLLLGYVGLFRLLCRSETPPTEVRGLFETMADGTRWIRLLVSQRLLVPLSCGLWWPTVVLPAGMCKQPAPRQLRWIFAHELTHLRRRDAWSALLLNLGQIFFFALPWYWWLRRNVRLCQEYVADAIAAEQDEGAVDYAEFLVSLANAPAVPVGASAVSGNHSDLLRRVTMLLNDPVRVENRCSRRWTVLMAGGLMSLAVLVSGFGYRAEAADQDTIIITQPSAEESPTSQVKDTKTTQPSKEKIELLLEGIELRLLLNDISSAQVYKALVQVNSKMIVSWARIETGQLELRLLLNDFTKEHLKLIEDVLGQLKPKRIEIVPRPKDAADNKTPQQVQGIEDLRILLAALEQNRQGEPLGTKAQAAQKRAELLRLQWRLLEQRSHLEQKAQIGLTIEAINTSMVEHLKLPNNVGLLVTKVAADSPADKAGIKVNDILVKITGAMVPDNAGDFYKLVANLKTGTPLEVVVLRKGTMQKAGSLTLPGSAKGLDEEIGSFKVEFESGLKADGAKWSKWGKLERTAMMKDDQRIFRFLDERGNTLVYAVAAKDLTLEPYINREIRLYGVTLNLQSEGFKGQCTVVSQIELP